MNIFVSGIPDYFGRRELFDLFTPYGEVSIVKVITNLDTGISRCFGFVEMPKEEEAKRAIASLHGSVLEERKLAVKEAREKEK